MTKLKISIKCTFRHVLIALFLPAFALAQNDAMPAPAGEVTGAGNYIHIVEDLDKTLAFYHALLGAEPRGGMEPREFGSIEQVGQMYNALGAEFRGATIPVPNTDLGMEFLEWRGVQRPILEARFYDPGSPVFLLFVRDINVAVDAVINNGGSIVTPSGEPVGTGRQFIFVQDPDGYFIELLQLDPTPATEQITNVLYAAFRFTVADANQSAEFYNVAFGFDFPEADDFNDDALLGAITGLGIARSRLLSGMVPGSNLNVEVLEFVKADKQKVQQSLPAVGSSLLRIFVRDLDISVSKALRAGGVLAANNEQAVRFENGNRMQILEDRDGLLLQLVERSP
tara:strand:+ start:63 stop:1082 length:1020 start_codon:yes stop_codon:yes gene_type:complete